MQWEVLGPERQHFLIEMEGGALFYAPLAGGVFLVSESVANEISRLFGSDRPVLGAAASYLETLGLFEIRSTPSERRGGSDWKPTSVTISTTQKCTLRCTYCYAEGGRMGDIDIPDGMLRDAITLIVGNAVDLGRSPRINFIGEGEATANWAGFRFAVEKFREECARAALQGRISLSTNGVMRAAQIDYVLDAIDQITVSLDGTAAIHDANRVLPNGHGSFALVVGFMQRAYRAGKRVGVRASLSRRGCEHVEEFVELLAPLGCRHLHLEPISEIASFTGTDLGDLVESETSRFVDAFRKARSAAAKHRMEVYYSGSKTSIGDSFCGATAARTFMITSGGLVTSCNEVLYEKDRRSALFHYGRWSEGGGFHLDPERIAALGRLNGDTIAKCQQCFARFTCAGDCYAKTAATFGQPFETPYTVRCGINRELLRDELLLSLLARAAKGETVALGSGPLPSRH